MRSVTRSEGIELWYAMVAARLRHWVMRLTCDELERKVMEQGMTQRLREILEDLPPEDVHAIIAFAQFLSERRHVERENDSKDELTEEEHTTILRVLNAVADLSAETGSPVSNRDHDRHIYGKD
jgi:hypothetical protein